jgi:hypothetical protein
MLVVARHGSAQLGLDEILNESQSRGDAAPNEFVVTQVKGRDVEVAGIRRIPMARGFVSPRHVHAAARRIDLLNGHFRMHHWA